MNWVQGQFALLQGQIVEIMGSCLAEDNLLGNIRIRLVNDKLLHWVNSKQLQPLTNQIASKVLYEKIV